MTNRLLRWFSYIAPYYYFVLISNTSATMPPCKHRTANRRPPLRKMTSSSLSQDDLANASKLMVERADSMGLRAKERSPLTSDELNDIIHSLHNITPHDANIDWKALEQLLMDIAHLSHKDWHVTGRNSNKMAEILLPKSGGGLSTSSTAQQMFERILHEGNWDGAVAHATAVQEKMGKEENDRINANPWAVLVTGVNGIRKTTSIYQPWFSKVLKEALIPPTAMSSTTSTSSEIPLEMLPNGDNSFFRQLDHMITTLCNEDFALLYALTCAQLIDNEGTATTSNSPPKELISKYSNLKASIFSRYRTLSELLGVLLLNEAQAVNINAMCETSGRDVAMFHYIDHFFPSRYNKLALHFTINDLSHAKKSVDERMVREMMLGKDALESGDVVQVIYSNQGGPYGSEVLEGVQADSDRVWNEIVMADDSEANNNAVGKDWYKATMQINAYSDKPWTIQAVRADGSLGTEYMFGEPRAVC